VTQDFDELVGHDVDRAERERLRRVHALLVEAGPPPELPPQLEAGPTLAMTLARRPSRAKRRIALLAAALAVLAAAFVAGYLAGNTGGGLAGGRVIDMKGTPAAPEALASLELEPVDAAGNLPMTLSATGLPELAPKEYYEVWLVRANKRWAPCGSFVAEEGSENAVRITLNAPYTSRKGDTWVVTKHAWDEPGHGVVVLRPTV
jgi:hypothetical protein